MPIFKYTVANKEGKKLNGTIEVPNEELARSELNNLGFSILNLEQQEAQNSQEQKDLEKFVFEALDKHSKEITGTIPSSNEEETYRKLTKEYDLTVTAIWKEGSNEEEISKARIEGTKKFQEALRMEEEAMSKEQRIKTIEEEKNEQFIKSKIENVLVGVNSILQEFDKEFDKTQKMDINKKINKILRIKHSSNLEYILASAEELLNFLQAQEKVLKEKGLNDKQLELSIKTRELLNNLKKTGAPKTLSDDILRKIESWEESTKNSQNFFVKFIRKILANIKEFLTTPPEIKTIQEQIRGYDSQIFNFIKLYFKEASPEYKMKIKNSIKTIWTARKNAKKEISRLKKEIRDRKKLETLNLMEESFITSLTKELNALTGWLLAFYVVYYFLAIYLTTKDFGLAHIPKSITVYESHTFKYIFAIIFLLHATTSLKVNFFKKSLLASIILIPIFLFTSIIALLNL